MTSHKKIPSLELLKATHQFPARYTFKIIGHSRPGFLDEVKALMESQPHISDLKISSRTTPNQQHVAVTAEPLVESAEAVYDLYEKLLQVNGLLMLL